MSPTAKKITFFVVLCGLLIGAGDLLWEMALRYPSYIPDKARGVFTSYYYEKDQTSIQASPDCAQYDNGLFYTLKPGECSFSSRYFDTSVSINSLGVRDDESSLVKPEIIVLGDSESMGWGVEKEETFADLIEKKTGRKVLNMGVSSYGTVRELKILQRADISNLKVLIIQLSGNDFRENKRYYLDNNQLKISDKTKYVELQKKGVINNYPAKPLIWFFLHVLEIIKNGRHTPLDMDMHEKYFFNALKHSSIPLEKYVVIVLGLKKEGSMRPDLGTKTYYLTLPKTGELRYPIDSHLNVKGHQHVAEKILKVLPVDELQ